MLPGSTDFVRFGGQDPIPRAGAEVIQVTINGEQKSIGAGMTVSSLLAELEMNSRAIAVEINQQILPRNTHHQTPVNSGDVLEIVTLVGGG